MRSHLHHSSRASSGPRTGLARALSKLGYCSRSQAVELIKAGKVRLNQSICKNPEQPVQLGLDCVEVCGQAVQAQEKVYLMLNKPRGLITSTADEKGRDTVYECFSNGEAPLPKVSPVGRLDKASEGLLLFTNDTSWAAQITDPKSRLEKTYHVQVNCLADESLFHRIRTGVHDEGDFLAAKKVSPLREGEKNSWIEIVLDEGKNRHIRRLLQALEVTVLRLVRISIGSLELGSLPKGSWRYLTLDEVDTLKPRPLHPSRR